MNFPTHLVLSTAVAVPLKYAFNFENTSIFVFIVWSSFLIDIDHIFYYAIKHRTLSFKKWLEVGKKMRNKMQPGLFIFHSLEFNLLLLLFSALYPWLLIFFLGSIVHTLLDTIEHYRYHRDFKWIKKWSIFISIYS